MDNEIRQNKITREWVIYSTSRGKRPHDFQQVKAKTDLPRRDPDCPFCPGNESALGQVVLETPADNPHGWQTRVIPNKYPAVTPGDGPQRQKRGIYLAMGGTGRHEVIIESPFHDDDLAKMSAGQIAVIMETYHRRYMYYGHKHENMMAIIFRNHGPKAGTSLIHPHSQAVVIPMVPRHIRLREQEAQRYYDQYANCAYCDMLAFEEQDGRRLVQTSEHFTALVPFAAEVPFEIWIMPKKHQPDFGETTEEERADLASLLGTVLRRLADKLNDPDYNYVINTAARFRRRDPSLHWYLRIRPRLTTQAGFEIGSGISINPSVPEQDAAFLRD